MNDTRFLSPRYAVSEFQMNGAHVGAVYAFTGDNSEPPTTVQVKPENKDSGVISWGANNDYPQKIRKLAKKNGSVQAGVRLLRKMHYGNGTVFLKDEATPEGKKAPRVIPLNTLPDVQAFFKKSVMQRFFKEIIMDLEWLSVAFPEYILSHDFSIITRVKRQRAAWCRFGWPDENGFISHVYISELFGKQAVSADSEYCEKVQMIDNYWSADEVKEYCKKNKIHKFIRPVHYPLFDESYYPEAEWHTIMESGWLEVANSIPEYKNNLFKNQVSIKYLISIDERYFEKIHAENWKKYTPEKKVELRKEVVDFINNSLMGNDKAGKSILSMRFEDDQGNEVQAVKIETIDDKFKDGSYLPEATAANSEILFAMGVDPSLIGAGIPGGQMGAGSGSDKNAAFNILAALFSTNRETTLEVFDFVSDYNGWDPDIQLRFENTLLTTLDKNPTGQQKQA